MSDYVYVLRTSNADGTSHGGFKWPKRGKVEAPDFKPTKECGNGLHGLLWGTGGSVLLDWSDDALWQVVKVLVADVIDLGDKVKFPRGSVVYSGDRKGATDYIHKHAPNGTAVIGCFLTGGDYSTLTGGDYSTLTGGNRSTLTGGYDSTLTIKRWDGNRYRLYTAYVGEDGIKANTPYTLSPDNRFVEVAL